MRADITPNVLPVTQLLRWSGGAAGATPDLRTINLDQASRTELSASLPEIGSVTATAWVAKINLDLSGVKDADEDWQAAPIKLNNNDDNRNSSSDLNDTTVSGERDLVPLALSVEPAGIGGALSLTQGDDTQLYSTAQKGTAVSTLSWDLSTRLPGNEDTDENPPTELYVEGRAVSSNPGDQHFTLSYSWGSVSLSDNVYATIGTQSVSDASIEVYKLDNQRGDIVPANLASDKYNPLGGRVAVAFTMKVGVGERLDSSIETATLRIKDVGYPYPDNVVAQNDTVLHFDTTDGWYQQDVNGEWVSATVSPKTANDGTTPRLFRYLVEWNTKTGPSVSYNGVSGFAPPMGHNGEHCVSIVEINGKPGTEVSFQHQENSNWLTPYKAGPGAKNPTVRNLVVTGVNATYGTVDYLKYDPDASSQYNRPIVNFSIEDDGDAHKYHCWVMIQPTGEAGQNFLELGDVYAFAYTYAEDECTNPMPVAITWDGSKIESRDTLARTYIPGAPDSADWGTYTYDVIVQEYDDNDSTYLDRFAYKWPYCLTVGEHSLEENFVFDENANSIITELRGKYNLVDFSTDQRFQQPNFVSPSQVEVFAINLNLDEILPIEHEDNSSVLGLHGSQNGILLCRENGFNSFSGWRMMITGQDNCWTSYRRDHLPTYMLAVNREEDFKVDIIGIRLADLYSKGKTAYIVYDNDPAFTLYLECNAIFRCTVKPIIEHEINITQKSSSRLIHLIYDIKLDQDGYGATGYQILHGSNNRVRKKYSKSIIPLNKYPLKIDSFKEQTGQGPGGFEIIGKIDKDSQGKATVTMNYTWYDNVGYNIGLKNATQVGDTFAAIVTKGISWLMLRNAKDYDIIIKWEDTFTYNKNKFEDGWFDDKTMKCSTWLYPLLTEAVYGHSNAALKLVYYDIEPMFRPDIDFDNFIIRGDPHPYIIPSIGPFWFNSKDPIKK